MRTQICQGEEISSAVTEKFNFHSDADLALPKSTTQSVASPALPQPAVQDQVFPAVPGYELLSVLGLGGMGIVYEARHRDLNRRAAIKMLRGEALSNPEFRERFRAEAEAIARLQHPNIIQVFDVGTLESQPGDVSPRSFLALEFVDGGNLTHRLSTPQTPLDAARMMEALARAAHAAHQLGIIHRDLKPANVLLTQAGEPKIADFGIAKQVESEYQANRHLTRTGTVMGTPEYMAPEQFLEARAEPAIDIYSLGVIFYEMLTARVPFKGASFADTMTLALRQEPIPPRQLQPSVPLDLEVICLKCLEKQPSKRYESAAALAEDLARWQAGLPIAARPVGPIERVSRWAKRNPEIASLSLAVIWITLTGLAGIVWKWREARFNAMEALDYATKAEHSAEQARDSANKERWERYRVSLVAASSALRLHDRIASRKALDDAPSEFRNWVWNLLDARLERSQHVLRGQGNPILSTLFSRDRHWALLRDSNEDFRIWNLNTKQEFVHRYAGKSFEPMAISPDGSTIAYSSELHQINVVDVQCSRLIHTLKGHSDGLHNLRFSADCKQIISGSRDHTFRIWDAQTGSCLKVLINRFGQEGACQISPSARFAVFSDHDNVDEVRIWDLNDCRVVSSFKGHDFRVLLFAFNSQEDRIASCELYPSNVIRVWDVPSGRLLFTLRGHENQLNCIQFNHNSTRLASCGMDRTVRIWDISDSAKSDNPAPLSVLNGHTGWVNATAFSPDGSRLVSVSQDRTLRYWDPNSGNQLSVLLGHKEDVLDVTFNEDGKQIVSSSADGTVRLWDVKAIERDNALKGHQKYVYSAVFHPDGTRIASASWDGTARIWDVATGQPLLKLDHGHNQIVSSVAFHPAGQYLGTLARDDSLRLWDANTGQLVHRWNLPTNNWRDSRLSFCPGGERVASGSFDGKVRIWNIQSREKVAEFQAHQDAIRDVAFSPDGRLIASAGEEGDRTIQVWDVASQTRVASLTGHSRCVYTVNWNKDGSLLASGSIDGTVRVWKRSNWKEIGCVNHGINVYSIAFTPDNKLIAAACADNLIRFSDVKTLQVIAELSGHSDYVHSLTFSKDGTRMVSASGDRSIRVWDALPLVERAKR